MFGAWVLDQATGPFAPLTSTAVEWTRWTFMSVESVLPLCLVLPSALSGGLCTDYTKNGLVWSNNAVRMNQVQVVGSHNSYHIESELAEREEQAKLLGKDVVNLYYSHPALDIQLEHMHLRNLEIDILADPDGGNYAKPLIRDLAGLPYPTDPLWLTNATKVLHIPDADVHSSCYTLVSCLELIKSWMDAHPRSVPIPIMIEFKTAHHHPSRKRAAKVIPWADQGLLAGLDAEIRSVFPPERLITPDDIRRGDDNTLEESVLRYGWPTLESARGRIFFLMDNGPVHDVRFAYKKDRPNLEGRVLFTNAAPGDSDCAFQKLNEPGTDEQLANIQAQVRAGYYVRTRADDDLRTMLDGSCSTAMRDAAFRSGAQVVSTDFPEYGMSSRWGCDYAAKLPPRGGGGGTRGRTRTARCNPVNGPSFCDDDELEPGE